MAILKDSRPTSPRSIVHRVVFGSLYLAIVVTIVTAGTAYLLAERMLEGQMEIEGLVVSLAALTSFLLGSAVILSVLLARRVTHDLGSLMEKVRLLRPGHWAFDRTVHSRDEVELLDSVIADLTARLRDSFGALEEEIAARTQELHEQWIKDRTILQSIEHGVLLFDAQGSVTDANPASVRMLGKTQAGILGKDAMSLLPLRSHQALLQESEHPIALCIHGRGGFRQRPDMRLSIVCDDGTLLPILLTVSPLQEDGKNIGGIAVFQDVTEERQVDYMKSEFISLASHQLRTPLSTVLWYLELLQGEQPRCLTSEQQSYVSEMQSAASRMSGLLDALLQVSRLEGNGIRPATQLIDLTKFVGETIDDVRALGKEHRITFEFVSQAEALKLQTDPTLLSIVLQNVLSNAVKYSPAGKAVSVSLQTSNEQAEIVVSDTGIGIPEADLSRLFQKLFRAENVKKVDTTGSGLGLYISRMVMERLGGDIALTSKENQGTRVVVRLPLRGK